jgi:hypothetical protein
MLRERPVRLRLTARVFGDGRVKDKHSSCQAEVQGPYLHSSYGPCFLSRLSFLILVSLSVACSPFSGLLHIMNIVVLYVLIGSQILSGCGKSIPWYYVATSSGNQRYFEILLVLLYTTLTQKKTHTRMFSWAQVQALTLIGVLLYIRVASTTIQKSEIHKT